MKIHTTKKFIGIVFIFITALMVTSCAASTQTQFLRGWNHIQTVRIYGKDTRPSKEDYMTYISSRYVERIDFIRYNYCTTEKETSHFDKNGIQLKTSDGVKLLDVHVFRPVYIWGYSLSFPDFWDMDFEIVEGRMFERDDECVIMHNSKRTEVLLQDGEDDEPFNLLEVGDKIIFENDDYDIYKVFTIVGILQENPNLDKNSNTRMIYTTFESAEYFDVLNKERTNLIARFSEYSEKDFLMGYTAVTYLTYDSYDKFYRYISNASEDAHGIEPIDPISLKPIYD